MLEMTPKIRKVVDEAMEGAALSRELRSELADTEDRISLEAIKAVLRALKEEGRTVRLHEVLAESKPLVPLIVVPPEVPLPFSCSVC